MTYKRELKSIETLKRVFNESTAKYFIINRGKTPNINRPSLNNFNL